MSYAAWFLRAMVISAMAFCIVGCASHPIPVVTNTKCHPAQDLLPTKSVILHPEVATANDIAFGLWLEDRAAWAKDVQDYNSLYATCVGADDGK